MRLRTRFLRSVRRETDISEAREQELLERLSDAMLRFSTPRRSRSAAPLYNDILAATNPVVTREGPTLFVRSHCPYGVVLGLNPDFVLGEAVPPAALSPGRVTGLDEGSFQAVLAHEAEHVLCNHIGIPVMSPLHRDAREIAINFRMRRVLGVGGAMIPQPSRTDPATGAIEQTGLDPVAYFELVVDRCAQLRIRAPQEIAEFAAYEMDTLGWLTATAIAPVDEERFARGCGHSANPDDVEGPDSPAGTDGLDELVASVVRAAALTAGPGTAMDRQLGMLLDFASADEARLWGSLGVGASRTGVLAPVRRNRLPIEDLAAAMATRLTEGERLKRLNKSLSENEWRWRRHETSAVVAVFCDTSASVDDATLELVNRAIGMIPGATVALHAFDSNVYPFTLSDPMPGGGGTSFGAVEEHVLTGRLDDGAVCRCWADGDPPDLVCVVTDGEADPVEPDDPDTWFWIVLPGGDADAVVRMVDMPVLALAQEDLEALAGV